MKKYKSLLLAGLLLLPSIASIPTLAHADAKVGDTYLTLGEDLTLKEKEQVYRNLGITTDIPTTNIVYVTNAEEHKYLGAYISKQQIGSTALSSSKIEVASKGSGIVVALDKNITYITDAMYINALATSGVDDVKVSVTAPYEVSGTAALTGIIKSYEKTTGEKIPEAQKQAANEEMVVTAKLSEDLGEQKTSELIQSIKTEISEEKKPENLTEEAISTTIDILAAQHGITLTDANKAELIDLFNTFKELDVDWTGVIETVDNAQEKLLAAKDKAKDKLGEKMTDLAETTPEEEEKVNGFFNFIKDVVLNIKEFFGNLFT